MLKLVSGRPNCFNEYSWKVRKFVDKYKEDEVHCTSEVIIAKQREVRSSYRWLEKSQKKYNTLIFNKNLIIGSIMIWL